MKLINTQYKRYLLTGVFFTFFGPILFVSLTFIFPIMYSSILAEIVIHSFRYKFYKYFIFQRRSSSPFTYLQSIAPISLLNISITISGKKNYNLKLWKVYKPDFVGNIPNDHSSRSIITNRFKRPTRTV